MRHWRNNGWIRASSLAAAGSLLLLPLLQPLSWTLYAQQFVEQLPRIAVIDFQNQSGYGGEALARTATDAVATEYQKSGRYTVLPRNEVEQQLKELDLTPPLNRLGYLRLGRALGIESIVTGEVKAVNFEGQPKQATVVLAVRVVDTASGETINGSVKTGRSNPRPGYSGDEDTLVVEAVKNAAFDAIRTILTYTIPEATILNTRGAREVVLNRGLRGGIKLGMEMIVIRRGEEVGRIRIKEVSDHDAVADVLAYTRGIQPEDRARAIFTLEEVKVKRGRIVTVEPKPERAKRKSIRGFETLLILGLIALGVVRASSGGNTATEQVTAEAMADGNLQPRVRLSWNANLFAKGNRFKVRWLIYRDPAFPESPQTVEGNQTSFLDTFVSAGVSYTYQLALEYQEPEQGDRQAVKTSDRVSSGQATAIGPVQLVSPTQRSQDVDPREVIFSWIAAAGANAYRIEVSYDITFRDRTRTFVSDEIPSTAAAGTAVSSDKINIEQGLNLPRGQRIKLYWRVGARNLNDSPGPVPDAGGLRYVWSAPFEFETQELPPPPQ